MKTPHDLKLDDPNETYYFVIGKESTGVPKEILREHLEDCIRIPTNDKIRSLNVSNVAAVVIFEALRQRTFDGLDFYDTFKGKDHILNN